MQQNLKTYKLTLKTVGPVYVGSGKEISKKEYVFLGKDKVAVLEFAKVYAMLKRLKKGTSFERYYFGNTKDNMNTWLQKEGIDVKQLKPFIKYTLDNSGAVIESKRELQIMEMIKDPYGKPYIPGSSLKGMLRTILLGQSILQNPKKYDMEKETLTQDLFANNKCNRNSFLKGNVASIENKSFHTLQREGTLQKDAVNDYLQGIIVSDSEPLEIDDLILCQKIDLHTDGKEKRFPLLRECLKPGTEIHFWLTIDSSICAIEIQDIMDAVKAFLTIYFRCFEKAFPGLDKLRVNQVYLGGGCGFVSKTVVYPMFGKAEGMKVTKTIFQKTGVPMNHKHNLDEKLGASPHILKCTRYQGKLLQMGLCNLKIQEIN